MRLGRESLAHLIRGALLGVRAPARGELVWHGPGAADSEHARRYYALVARNEALRDGIVGWLCPIGGDDLGHVGRLVVEGEPTRPSEHGATRLARFGKRAPVLGQLFLPRPPRQRVVRLAARRAFCSRVICSPAGDRNAWKIWRAGSGNSLQAPGATIASM